MENENYRMNLDKLNQDFLILKDKFKEASISQERYSELFDKFEKYKFESGNKYIELQEVNKQIENSLKKEINFKEEISLLNEKNIFRINLLNTNNFNLSSRLKLLEEEKTHLEHKLTTITLNLKDFEDQNQIKNDELQILKSNFNLIKCKQEMLMEKVDKVKSQNLNLVEENEEKQKLIESLTENIEQLKIEKMKSNQIHEEEIKTLKECNEKMKDEIQNVLRIKIEALKNKLKEKVDLLQLQTRNKE